MSASYKVAQAGFEEFEFISQPPELLWVQAHATMPGIGKVGEPFEVQCIRTVQMALQSRAVIALSVIGVRYPVPTSGDSQPPLSPNVGGPMSALFWPSWAPIPISYSLL